MSATRSGHHPALGGGQYLPNISASFDEARFDPALVPQLAELGLLGIKIEGYDCPGMSNVVYGLVCQELERGDSALRSFILVKTPWSCIPSTPLAPKPKRSGCRRWRARCKVGCFGLTEPDAGSDPVHMRTRAVLKGGDYVLNGSKIMWITNGQRWLTR